MAPAAQTPVKRATYDGTRPRFQTLESWLNVYGSAEYAIYKRDAAPNAMNYEDWLKSEHVLGPFLWYTTLDVWEEDSSSDEESDVETPAFTSRAPPKQPPNKSAIANGHPKRGAAKSSTSVAHSKSEDAAAAAKRKRKPKKPYLSEDIVVSDVSDEVDEPAPAVEAPPSAVTVPTSPTNGRRKSGGRKKKQYLSAETISPEDEDDDPMAMNGVIDTAAYAHKSNVPAEQHAPVAAATSETPKGKPGRKPKKKSLSQTIVAKDEDEQIDGPADAAITPKNAAASPDGPGSSSRRGLRTRTPAQQRPYFHNAQVFDDLVSGEPEAETDTKPSPPKAKQKLKLTNLSQISYSQPEEEIQEQEEETILADDDDEDDLVLEPEEPHPPRKAHYKGKGRAWKKTSDDEDGDYKSPVKIKSNQPKRKLGRRKSAQAADMPADTPANEEPSEQQRQDKQEKEVVEPAAQSSSQKAGKKQRKPRKIHNLSEEFVKDDSDDAPEEPHEQETKTGQETRQAIIPTSLAQKTAKAKGRGRPRKSDQNTIHKDVINLVSSDHATPSEKKLPPKKRTPKESAEIVTLTDSEDEKSNDLDVVRVEDSTQQLLKPELEFNALPEKNDAVIPPDPESAKPISPPLKSI